ncbi:MAG: hypothetical protein QF921_10215 [Pseudomonadales bacterium]|jgi:hypothetical protein|nr:hypothetical protein [Pseudomonadales bacterium]MDP6470580.1 hypothetical protein [Pseudomonadales bacterium]MDP6828565.1 hypothetical protein [Pseudomonadales bacterium]MDP6971869.1 hypothetical protein [Pseudomonadales bacterium]|tara:strand:+ start:764 stop:949 length:186 start_codon:yes stop_codon:yes gene_type:complete
MLEFRDLTQMDAVFALAATRGPDVESIHSEVYSKVQDAKFALYRDFPDEVRDSHAARRAVE